MGILEHYVMFPVIIEVIIYKLILEHDMYDLWFASGSKYCCKEYIGNSNCYCLRTLRFLHIEFKGKLSKNSRKMVSFGISANRPKLCY